MKECFKKCLEAEKDYKFLTDLIPLNKRTILYGKRGCGKTGSIIKHLNRHKVTPLLVNYDGQQAFNFKVDYHILNGVDFYDEFEKDNLHRMNMLYENENQEFIDVKQSMVDFIDEINSRIEKHNKNENNTSDQRDIFFDGILDYEESITYSYLGKVQKDEWENLMLDYRGYSPEKVKRELMSFKDETIVIDSYQMCIKHLVELDKLKDMVQFIINDGGTVIIIAHSDDSSSVLQFDKTYADNSDCVLQLNFDMNKTRRDVYLNVEKIRNYYGKRKIENWEDETLRGEK